MTTSIDTNILVALWNEDELLNQAARGALDTAHGKGNLVISAVVHAELLAAPGRNVAFVDRFCERTGIAIEWTFSEKVWRTAGLAFQDYAIRRKRQKETQPRRILADFLIGAHAQVNDYNLLTLDAGIYRAAFPKLSIITL
jgi:predicted nucleic acid-binding protein